MTLDSADWSGRSLAGERFQVKARLGGGFLGAVYLARDQKLSCDVVLRVPPTYWLHDPEFASRFFQDVLALASFVHTHVAKVIDLAEHDGLPFAVVQYFPGGSLRTRQRKDAKGKPLRASVDDLRSWLEPVAQTLDELHLHKKTHRDVRPENILFNVHGEVGLSDFCLTGALAGLPPKKQAALLEGTTSPYWAPETQPGFQGDSRADQFALAVTVYELLAGHNPFLGAREKGFELRPLHNMATLSQSVSDAVHKALCRDSDDRFASCSQFAQAILATAAPVGTPNRDAFW